MRALIRFFALCLFLCPALLEAQAQVGLDAEFAGFGARSLGMGSAFIGMADDATASEFNPAGLVILERPEVALQTSYMIDRHRELQPIEFSDWLKKGAPGESPRALEYDRYFTPPFFAVTYPTKLAVLSLSKYSPIFFKRSLYDSNSKSFLDRSWESQLTNYGLSAAFAPLPKLYLGATLKYGQFEYSQKDRMSSGTYSNSFTGDSIAGNFGFRWQMHPWFSLGGVYKTSQRVEGTYGANLLHLKIPRTMGMGLAFHPNDKIRILADVDTIEWSEFLEERNKLEPNYDRNDVRRYHLGGEYLLGVFGQKSPTALFLRCGAMREESSRLYYHGTYAPLRKSFPEEGPIDHASVGFGAARSRYQIDLALDQSSKGTQCFLSTVIYF